MKRASAKGILIKTVLASTEMLGLVTKAGIEVTSKKVLAIYDSVEEYMESDYCKEVHAGYPSKPLGYVSAKRGEMTGFYIIIEADPKTNYGQSFDAWYVSKKA